MLHQGMYVPDADEADETTDPDSRSMRCRSNHR